MVVFTGSNEVLIGKFIETLGEQAAKHSTIREDALF